MIVAFAAGTIVALMCGVTGYFVVLRAQVFVGDALSHVAFTGAFAALAAGIDLRLGLFVATVAVAVGMGLLGRKGQADDVVIGSVFVWMLGLGVLFLSIFTSHRSGGSRGSAGVSVLFGSIFGLQATDLVVLGVAGAVVVGTLAVIARPLLFASIDSSVAAARGVPVFALGAGFLGIVGVTAAATTEAVGALLLLGLLAAPAAAAQRLDTRPFAGMALSAGIAIGSTWIGLVLAHLVAPVPPSFAIVAVAVASFAGASAWSNRILRRSHSVLA